MSWVVATLQYCSVGTVLELVRCNFQSKSAPPASFQSTEIFDMSFLAQQSS